MSMTFSKHSEMSVPARHAAVALHVVVTATWQVCVCERENMCVCVREGEGERKRESFGR